MKRKILLLTIIGMLIAFPVFAGGYVLSVAPYPVLVNGTPLKSILPVMTYKLDGDNTYVPLRAVLDMVGAKTTWDGKSVNITTSDPSLVANSVVQIYVVKNGRDVSRGSGVLIDYDEILTCSHVVDNADSYRIIFNDGHTTTAKLKDDAPEVDAAILEPVEKKTKPVKMGDSEEIKEGDQIFTVSSPKGNKNTVLNGRVIDDYITTVSNLTGFRTSTIAQPGGSGGGVFNINGELLGVVNASNGSDTFAVPINDIRKEFIN